VRVRVIDIAGGGRRLTFALALPLLLAACEGESSTPPYFGPTILGEAPPRPECVGGDPCDCGVGTHGLKLCNAAGFECYCEGCGDYAVSSEPAPFDACGGDPSGLWSLTERDVSAAVLRGEFRAYKGQFECHSLRARDRGLPTDLPAALLRLNADGTGNYSFTPRAAATIAVANDCLSPAPVQDGQWHYEACEALGCLPYGCGVCECLFEEDLALAGAAHWSTGEAQLDVVLESGEELSFAYCVAADELRLRDLHSGIDQVLVPATVGGTPIPCSERSAAHCRAGCEQGACFGVPEACASATTSAACFETDQRCGWAEGACRGEDPSCEFADYGVLPGCEIFVSPT
jgi:hypothetical protein